MAGFLDLSPEIRLYIYEFVFSTTSGALQGLSNGSKADYCCSACFKDVRAHGGDKSSNKLHPRSTRTDVALLKVSRLVNAEAAPLFYGTNVISLHAENNLDILNWLRTIDANRKWIRHLEIDFSYGVLVESQRFNVRQMLAQINILRSFSMEGLNSSISSWFRYDHMKKDLQSLENGATRMMAVTLELVAEDQGLEDLAVLLPGRDGGDMWDVKNDSVYFAEETFSGDNINGHAAIVSALSKIVGLKKLTIGYTHDHGLAEAVARSTGAEEVAVRADEWLGFTQDERNEWEDHGWSITNMEARKVLLPDV
ncbi:hypothetical protein B0A49_09838, partial [Cryomyces minteri]